MNQQMKLPAARLSRRVFSGNLVQRLGEQSDNFRVNFQSHFYTAVRCAYAAPS